MTDRIVVLDCGNGDVKAISSTSRIIFPHALAQLTEEQIQTVEMRSGTIPPGYIRVNGTPYAFGNAAEAYPSVRQATGASRYVTEYYGVLASAALSMLYTTSATISLLGSHPPGDVAYRDALMDAALGKWEVECRNRTYQFDINTANTFDEPHGGFMNIILDHSGTSYESGGKRIADGRSLVIDIGAKTTDWLAVNPNGEIDHTIAFSIDEGIRDAVNSFKRSLRYTYRDEIVFRSMTEDQMRPDRVREAIATGSFRAAGISWPCEGEAKESISSLLSSIWRVYTSDAGGPGRWDTIVLTGGGSWFVHDQLFEMLNHGNIILAGSDIENLRYANVTGGMKLWKLWRNLGKV